ncbi:MAG: Holliday junction resolvase RuvX [Bacilli bacterium]|nr:Holliday junction resolvase RuvX [Bacilli bacterium]
MRYIGLDLGSKTLGVSISDATGTIANILTTIRFKDENYDSLIEPLSQIVKENNVSKIILGLPKNMNNSLGERAIITLDFKKKIEENINNVEVILEDERLTTVISNNVMIEADISRKKRKQKKDGISALLILQNYLDRKGE